MALSGEIIKSIWGRALGLNEVGQLVSREYNDEGNAVKIIAKKLFSAVAASTAVANTVTETAFDQSYTVPANMLQVGSMLRIRFQGIAPLTNATDTLTIKLYIGGLTGTVLLTCGPTDVANNNIFAGEFNLLVRTTGATGTFVGWGMNTATLAASGTATMVVANVASTTINTTVSQAVTVSATWSVANAGDSCRLDCLTVELL